MPIPNQSDYKKRLREILTQLSYEKKEVILASGRKSDFYFDGRQTALNPEGAFLLGELFADLVESLPVSVEAVGGPTLGADPLVTSLSLAFYRRSKNIPAFIIRKEAKGYGGKNWIEGLKNLKPGMKVVLVEDVVTTGESSLTAAKKVKEAGFDVVALVSMIDREEGGRENIEASGLPFYSLFKRTDFIVKN